MNNKNLRFLQGSAPSVARQLLGCTLIRTLDHHILKARIVETEAYDETDAASHSHNGRTPRTNVMFGEAGHLYVYFSYGMHYCCNIVVGSVGEGSAVLIRAVEPLEGESIMEQYRKGHVGKFLTNGPAKLCQALSIDGTLNGHSLTKRPLNLLNTEVLSSETVVQTTRIGISRAIDTPWRFYIKNNPYVSRA